MDARRSSIDFGSRVLRAGHQLSKDSGNGLNGLCPAHANPFNPFPESVDSNVNLLPAPRPRVRDANGKRSVPPYFTSIRMEIGAATRPMWPPGSPTAPRARRLLRGP